MCNAGLILSQALCNNARKMKRNASGPLDPQLISQCLLFTLMKCAIYPFIYFLFDFMVSKNIYTLFTAHHISEFLDIQPERTDFKGH